MRVRLSTSATALVGILLTAGGCAVGPDFKPPEVAANKSWSTGEEQHVTTKPAADSLWWKAFHDATLESSDRACVQAEPPTPGGGPTDRGGSCSSSASPTGRMYPQTQVAFANALGRRPQREHLQDRRSALATTFGYRWGSMRPGRSDVWGKYRRLVQSEAANVVARRVTTTRQSSRSTRRSRARMWRFGPSRSSSS